jgi:signal transduction histidine kinase
VLVNLLMNAIQSVEQVEGLRSIDVRAFNTKANEKDAKPMIAIEVADNGLGLPEEVRAHLFEAFFTTKPPGRGTGLGLAVVRSIVEEHAGSIEVGSLNGAHGSGAVFRVLLPAAPAYHV